MLATADQTQHLEKACWEDDLAHSSNSLEITKKVRRGNKSWGKKKKELGILHALKEI